MSSLEMKFSTEAAAELGLAPRAINAALRRAARLWGTKTLGLARAKAPALRQFIMVLDKKYPQIGSSLALKKSLGVKVSTNKKTGEITAVVGPRRGKSIEVVNPRTGAIVKVSPTRYAHLVEKGFLAKLWRSGKRVWVSARPFLKPAEMITRNYAVAITQSTLNDALDKLASTPGGD